MAATLLDAKDLRREISDFKDRYPNLGNDELFVLWFLRAFIAEDEAAAVSAVCGGPGDKGVDAILIDERARIVFVIQGKYREKIAAKAEHRGDVIGFAQRAVDLCGDGSAFASLLTDLSPDVARRAEDARSRIKKRSYSVQFFYVTLGRCSASLHEEARRTVRAANGTVSFQLFDGRRILLLLSDYLDGVAPPVPSLDLEIESGNGVHTAGVFNRYDSKTDIESWVFSMTDRAVAGLFERAGVRLFARNVRGFLGNTDVNRGMEGTLSREPEYFWYYNNGITIVCDAATHESSRGSNVLRVANPQVINGQQTTRTLARALRSGASRASVLVRVIRVPRTHREGTASFETLVSRIVAATNWQNAIRASDLMSNDRRQVELDRHLRKLNYLYIRKRTTKGEAKRAAGSRHLRPIKKEELAQAVAGCDLDPFIVREGKERLFEERWYAQIFPTSNPQYYLPRYWLMHEVSYAAHGYPERAYAKWLVLNFMWRVLQDSCRTEAALRRFTRACERNRLQVLRPLFRANDAVFSAALRFFRAKRGTGKKATDVSTFFKRRNLHKEFAQAWSSPRNKERSRLAKAMVRFGKGIEAENDR